MVNLHFFQAPLIMSYIYIYRVEHRSTNYRKMIKPTVGCIPSMSHGPVNVIQAEDGRVLFTESIMPGNFNPCT